MVGVLSLFLVDVKLTKNINAYLKVKVMELYDDKIHSLFESFYNNAFFNLERRHVKKTTLQHSMDILEFF